MHAYHKFRRVLIAHRRSLILVFWTTSTFAQAASISDRFSLVGTGTLIADAPAQTVPGLTLRGTLSKNAATSAGDGEHNGFLLNATLDATPLVCYNDTIFRDDFDGDGL